MNVLRVEMPWRVRAPRSWHAEKSNRRRPTDFSVIFRCEIYHPAKIVRTMATRLATDAQERGAELSELLETSGKFHGTGRTTTPPTTCRAQFFSCSRAKEMPINLYCSVPNHYRDPRIVVPTQLQILQRHISRTLFTERRAK
jgi:hypothetical protein